MKKGARRDKRRAAAHRLDIEAVGLVVLTIGAFLAGVLVPQLPSGELGRTVRTALTGRLGVGAYALPLPFLVLGALFLVRRSPRWWVRATLGYLLLVAGAWGVIAAAWPGAAGAWGLGLRERLGGAWGALAAVPAVVIASIGVDLLAGWPPTRLLRAALAAVVTGMKRTWRWLVTTREAARRRAAFQADVALARRALTELGRDLEALAELYPGSRELENWQGDVAESRARLGEATLAVLREVRADLAAWQSAVAGFAKDRAADLALQVDSEQARPPAGDDPFGARATTFEVWAADVKRQLADPIAQRGRAADAFDRLRKTLLLEGTALLERNRRLARERDLDKRALKGMSPRQLAGASQGHQRRLAELRAMEAEAEALEAVVTRFGGWRPLLAELGATLEVHQAHPLVADFHSTLASEIESQGRKLLGEREHVLAALRAVTQRAELDAEAAALRAAEERQAAEAAALAGEAFAGEALVYDAPAGPALTADGPAPDAAPPRRAGARWEAALIGDGELPAVDGEGEEGEEHDLMEVAASAEAAAGGAGHEAGTAGRTLGAAAGESGARPDPVAGDGRGRGSRTTSLASDAQAAPTPAAPEVGAIPIQVPPLELLDEPERPSLDPRATARENQERVRQIDDTLASFRLGGRVTSSVRGPSVTRFEVEPAPGEKISRFANLADDLALAMAVGSVRIEAPIPGKSVIGLEVPNAHRELVRFREAVASNSYRRSKARIPIVLGRSIDGDMMVGDLTRMPHLLIAGSTGSGKSVAVNTLISSLLYRFLPTEMRLLMIDPKMVELTPYDGIPHLLRPVVTNPADAAGVLLGTVTHMERRYKMMSKLGAKNLDQYNEKARSLDLPPLPFIAIIIDELADLMITSPKEVESAIMRLAQMARATGMHLILATQRPSVDILTSLIKVNVPARMAFAVSSSHDSRTILDSMGAERLIGMGDMLYYQPGLVKAVRLQGPFVSENEIQRLADFLRRQYFDDDFGEAYGADFDPPPADESTATGLIDWNDDKLRPAAELVINEGQASVSRLQRRLSVGHARAGKLMDSLEALGVVGPHQGSKPRDVLVQIDELPNIFGK